MTRFLSGLLAFGKQEALRLLDFVRENVLWILAGAALVALFILVVRGERSGPVWRKLAGWGPVRWVAESRTARRFAVNVLGVLLIVWGVKMYALWLVPAMTPGMMFPPTVIGLQGVDLAPVRQGILEDRVTYTGTLRPYEETVVYARTDGYVKSLDV